MKPWSLSKIKCFEDCKRKYMFSYIEKIKVSQTEALKKGSKVHSILENLNEKGEPEQELSDEQKIVNKFINSDIFKNNKEIILNSLKEIGVGVKSENNKLIPCKYTDKDCIFRGKIDLLSKNHILDYKTGKAKSFDDQDWTQLEWYAIWLFLNSNYDEVKISFLYVEHNIENTKIIKRENLKDLIKNMLLRIKNIVDFENSNKAYIPNYTNRCKFCPFQLHCKKLDEVSLLGDF